MLQHERVQEKNSVPAAKVAVSAEELAEALASLESRRDNSMPMGSVTLGEAVSELSLSYTSEELLAEVEARRARRMAPKRARWVAPRWLMAGGLSVSLIINILLLGGMFGVRRVSRPATMRPPAPVVAPGSLIPISARDHRQLVSALEGQNFDAGRMSFLKAAFRNRSFTSDQLREVLKTFDFDDLRIEAAVLLYPRVSDYSKFIFTLDAFQFDAGREAVLKRLGLN